jgi:hypothetical protein
MIPGIWKNKKTNAGGGLRAENIHRSSQNDFLAFYGDYKLQINVN